MSSRRRGCPRRGIRCRLDAVRSYPQFNVVLVDVLTPARVSKTGYPMPTRCCPLIPPVQRRPRRCPHAGEGVQDGVPDADWMLSSHTTSSWTSAELSSRRRGCPRRGIRCRLDAVRSYPQFNVVLVDVLTPARVSKTGYPMPTRCCPLIPPVQRRPRRCPHAGEGVQDGVPDADQMLAAHTTSPSRSA